MQTHVHFVSFVCMFSTSTSKFFFKRRRSQWAPGHQPATKLLVFTQVGCLLGDSLVQVTLPSIIDHIDNLLE